MIFQRLFKYFERSELLENILRKNESKKKNFFYFG